MAWFHGFLHGQLCEGSGGNNAKDGGQRQCDLTFYVVSLSVQLTFRSPAAASGEVLATAQPLLIGTPLNEDTLADIRVH